MRQGNLFVVAAPSGAGKTSLVDALLQATTRACKLSVSYTTRAPRPGETGRRATTTSSTDAASSRMTRARRVPRERRGARQPLRHLAPGDRGEAWRRGDDLLLEIDWQGAQQVRKLYPDCVGIFILPPSVEELEQRLRERGQDAEDVDRAPAGERPRGNAARRRVRLRYY